MKGTSSNDHDGRFDFLYSTYLLSIGVKVQSKNFLIGFERISLFEYQKLTVSVHDTH